VVIKVGEMYGVELELGRVNQKEQDKNKDKGVNALKMFSINQKKHQSHAMFLDIRAYSSHVYSLLFSPFIPFFSSFLHHQHAY
jgi:hypothetical protein